MLRIIQTKSAAGAMSYYSEADYLSEGQELVGYWGGNGALKLGLSGEVDKQSFDRLCLNQDPRSGERLTLRTKTDRTVGYDFNFHLPKAVSLAYLLNGDHEILDAFRQSMDETMREIEQDASTRVRKHGLQEERRTGNLAWGTYIHTTTRPVDGEPDPHLHGHCFVFNTTWDRTEEAWKAGQFRDIKRDARYYEAAFHARMARRVKSLGYQIKRDEKGWDIAGLEKKTKDKFSRRTAEIERIAAELGIEDDAAKDGLGATTRSKKDRSKSLRELEIGWRDRLNPAELQALANLKSEEPVDAGTLPIRDAEAVYYATAHCFERDSVIPERKFLGEALRVAVGDVTVEGVHAELGRQRLISRDMHGRRWITSHEVLAEETYMLERAKALKGAANPLNEHWSIRRDWLNDDQRGAIDHVLSSRDGIVMIRGGAGTGKTALMREAADGIEAGGKRVFTFAPSAEASRGVLAQEGFQSTTVAELLLSQRLQEELQDQVIWIDEAGLLGTRTLKQVIDIAEDRNARLILSGDWRQHGAVERGAAMRLLEEEAGIQPTIVRNIQRQSGEYREAVSMIAGGNIQAGFLALDGLGWIHEIDSAEERYQAMAKSYANAIESGQSVLAVAPTHAEADQLTRTIRSELVERKIVDSHTNSFKRLEPLHLTEAERGDPFKLAQGDVLVFHKAGKGLKKGDRKAIAPETVDHYAKLARQLGVYRESTLDLAKGDIIRITGNGKTKDGRNKLNNGQTFRIRDFSKRGDIVLENGWTIDRDYGFLASGYVSTSHSSQGKTVDRVLIAESTVSYPAADQAQFYVSVSRGRHQAEIYTDDKASLLEAVSRHDQRLSATELVHSHEPSRRHRFEATRSRHADHNPQKEREVVYERA